jgi:phage gp46-like protein
MDLAILYDGTAFIFDLAVKNGDLATDRGLLPAVLVSLFTDRRANGDDVLPGDVQGRTGIAGTGDRRGSWQDQFQAVAGDLPGSRLWLLSREKQLPDVLQRAQTYAEESLAWLIEDGIAKSVAAPAEWVAPGVLGLRIVILLVDGSRFATVIDYNLEG